MKTGELNIKHKEAKPNNWFGKGSDQMPVKRNNPSISLTFSRSHLLTLSHSYALTFSRSHVLTFSRSHALTFSRSHVLTFGILFFATLLCGQPTVKVEVSADTIKPGEFVEVTYTIENGEGRFEAPDLQNLPVVSGPNTSSSFMIQNGKKSSSQSYSYVLQGQVEGTIVIPEAYFHEQNQKLKIDSVTIVVLTHSNYSVSPPPDPKSIKATREKKKF